MFNFLAIILDDFLKGQIRSFWSLWYFYCLRINWKQPSSYKYCKKNSWNFCLYIYYSSRNLCSCQSSSSLYF